MRVALTHDGITKWYSTHRLVASHFIPNVEQKPQINHKDGNKQNNNVTNLEWCTNKENCRHAVINNLFQSRTNKKIVQLDLNNNFIKKWNSLYEIEDSLNIDKRLILSCCKHYGNTRKSKGFIWMYEEEYLNEQSNN